MLSPDAESSRNNILDAAEECFAESGYAGTSLRRVASIAGITQPLILHYFDSKQHLFDSVLHRAVREYDVVQHQQWQRHDGDPEFITVGLSVLFGWLKGKRRVMRLMQWARLEQRLPQTSSQGDDIWQRVQQQLQAAVAEGRLRSDLDVEATLILIDALSKGYWDRHEWYVKTRPGAVDVDAFVHRMQRTFLTTLVYALFAPEHQAEALASVDRIVDDA